ncbi:WD40 repeat-like protein [Xylariaceae sp. FL0594]|nr:WD40 repeat-like protein [Xylariaceae sp. FL0594]
MAATPDKDGNVLILTRDDAQRPPKRQRTDDRDKIDDVAARLGRCLESQVIPYIERETAALSVETYDIDKLGAQVIRTIVDKAFQQKFHEGHGRLSSAAELTIAAGIHRLVTELAAGPQFRRSTLLPRPPISPEPSSGQTPSILPSIENADDNLAQIKKEEDIGSENNDYEDDEDLDGVFDSEDDAEIEPEIQFNASSQPIQTPTPPLQTRKANPKKKTTRRHISPQQFRTKADAFKWQSGKSYHSEGAASPNPKSEYSNLPIRPYLAPPLRQQARSLLGPRVPCDAVPRSTVYHVDFHHAEIHYLQRVARILYGRPYVSGQRSITRDLRNVLKKKPELRDTLVNLHKDKYVGHAPPPLSLTKRSPEEVDQFFDDLYYKKLAARPSALSIEHGNPLAKTEATRASRMPNLLLAREAMGSRLGWSRIYSDFTTSAKCIREDYLEPKVEWTNCAGDLMTISWLSNTEFLCGTTTHSDSHNQQYNKPGNLLLGSAVTNTLRAYPDHRIVRPRVSSGENATSSMVASQDPWLFTSVVSSDYDPSCGLAFSSSFDKTVKVWKPEGGSMKGLGTWVHEGRVNFVVTSKNSTGRVATAADVPTEAVRVYHLDPYNVSGSRYDSYSCTRVDDEDYVPSEKWAYYPSAIRWGLAPEVKHLLLIGYSPRSPTGEDHEIPEDKLNTGELCLWDTVTRKQVRVSSAKTQNVFEVAWHPSRASFAAATSASQTLEKSDHLTRTQVRVFEFKEDGYGGYYSVAQILDCVAADINELSIRPNCFLYSYVAASCTDGKVYVWDTARSDLPMCVLEHGDPVEEILGNREVEDVGVKFTAWATTAGRLYTGSSDGVVKVWNIRHGRCVLVRDLVEVAAPITHGAFSPDFTKLVIGDGSGRVYLLALEEPDDDDDEEEDQTPKQTAAQSAAFLKVQTSNGQQVAVRRPRPFIPHPELPPPGEQRKSSDPEGVRLARQYLWPGQLRMHPDRTMGVVQGSRYHDTGLFRAEAHIDNDPSKPLLDSFAAKQQYVLRQTNGDSPSRGSSNTFPRQRENHSCSSSSNLDHGSSSSSSSKLKDKDEDCECRFDPATWQELMKEKAEVDDRLFEFDYETSICDSSEEHEP